jgi:Tfp pilus assembly protein FimT
LTTPRITSNREAGFSLLELSLVLMGAMIILGIAVPAAETAINQFRLLFAAQSITTQLQYARMKAVSSNEPF